MARGGVGGNDIARTGSRGLELPGLVGSVCDCPLASWKLGWKEGHVAWIGLCCSGMAEFAALLEAVEVSISSSNDRKESRRNLED